jgi:DNA polymerase III psi subunit
MTVTKRQYSHLSEMGINVWQQRNTEPTNSADENASNLPNSQFLRIDPTLVTDNLFFQDVLHSINCSVGDATVENNTINLGLINWRFIESNNIDFSHNVLITPPLQSLSNNTALKRELWQILNTKVLS